MSKVEHYPTMTPEERALSLIMQIDMAVRGDLIEGRSAAIPLIASAIREAENEALELACAASSGAIFRSIKFVTDHEIVALASCKAIRSIRHPTVEK